MHTTAFNKVADVCKLINCPPSNTPSNSHLSTSPKNHSQLYLGQANQTTIQCNNLSSQRPQRTNPPLPLSLSILTVQCQNACRSSHNTNFQHTRNLSPPHRTIYPSTNLSLPFKPLSSPPWTLPPQVSRNRASTPHTRNAHRSQPTERICL